MNMIQKKVSSIILLLSLAVSVFSQTSTGTEASAPLWNAPPWLKDLRRAEIVAFGAFPFAMFVSSFGVDTYRFLTHDGNMLYAPWPFNIGGVAEKTQDELTTTVIVAAGISLAVSLADFLVVRYKRRNPPELPPNQPGETPIIIRKPLSYMSE
ncbi:MAG: hypothetical protein LBC46_01850 [Treponema sp.]|jgi:hypothetical protein|nr:hypothetical protein [Treponema sp.]